MGYGKKGVMNIPGKNDLRPTNVDPAKTGDREVLKHCVPSNTIFDFRNTSPQYPSTSPASAERATTIRKQSPRHDRSDSTNQEPGELTN